MKPFSDVVIGPLEMPKPPRRPEWFRKTGRICLMGVALTVPFLFLPVTEDPAGINKMFIVGLLVLAAFVCFLGCVFEERSVAYPRSWFSLFFILFIAAELISALTSIAPSESWYGALRQPDSFMSIVLYALIFFLSVFFFRRHDPPKIGMLVGGGLLIATAIGLFSGFVPVGSVLGWGILLIMALAAIAGISLDELTLRPKILFFASAFIAFAALFVLNYEFLWIVLAIFTIIVAALRFGSKEHRFRYAFVSIVLALFFALVGPRLPVFGHFAPANQPGVGDTFSAVRSTLTGWRTFVGSGPATFALDLSTYPPLAATAQGHDFMLTLLATGGTLGFLLFLLMIVSAIFPFFRMQLLSKDLAMVVIAVTFLFAALFVAPAFFAGLVLLFLLFGVFTGETSRREISFAGLPRWQSFLASILIMVLAALSLSAAYTVGMQYAAAVLFEQSNKLTAAGNLEGAFQKIGDAIKLDRTDEYLRGASGILIAEAQRMASAGTGTATTDLPTVITNAVQAASAATVADPRDPENWGNLGSIYEAIIPAVAGSDGFAQGAYQKAADLDPGNPQWDAAIGRVLMASADLLPAGPANDAARAGKWNDAESFLQKAITINDDYADARVLLIQLYIKEGNIAGAIGKVQELAEQNPLDPGVSFELGYLYYQSNQLDEAQNEFQVATILNPNFSNARYFLGLIYDQKGMVPQALDQFERIQALNPGNAQVKQIIANLEAGEPALANETASSTLSGAATPSRIPAPKK